MEKGLSTSEEGLQFLESVLQYLGRGVKSTLRWWLEQFEGSGLCTLSESDSAKYMGW